MVSVPFTLSPTPWNKRMRSFAMQRGHMSRAGPYISWRLLMVCPDFSSTTVLEKWSTMRAGSDFDERGDTRRPSRKVVGAGRMGQRRGRVSTGS